MRVLAFLLSLLLAPCAQAMDPRLEHAQGIRVRVQVKEPSPMDDCAANYAERVKVAAEIARLVRLADKLWPQGEECNMRCAALQKAIGRLLDEQLALQAAGEAMHCPLHPEGE